jgi:hypothetical protein
VSPVRLSRRLRRQLAVGVLAVPAGFGGTSASASVPHYPAKWHFNANDGSPNVVVTVSAAGAFHLHYLPSYCSGAGFAINGTFTRTHYTLEGETGTKVNLTISGSCEGTAKNGNSGNTFTWSKPKGVAAPAWPSSSYVLGEMTQTACVTGGTCGPISIDWGMSVPAPQ